MNRRIAALALSLAAVVAAPATAQRIATTVSSSTVLDASKGSLSLLNDGVYPPNASNYQTNTVHDFGSTYFTFDFGGSYALSGFNLTVDNNDDYIVAFYNGSTLLGSGTILASDGVVPVSPGGVETFSSSPLYTGTVLASLTAAVPAGLVTSARISAANGDGLYAIGEAGFFGRAVAGVPEPATWAMMLAGFAMTALAIRRGIRRSETRFDERLRRIAAGEELA